MTTETTYKEVKYQTGKDCKELRQYLKLSIDEVSARTGYSKGDLILWEDYYDEEWYKFDHINKDAISLAYWNIFTGECTSPLEASLYEMFETLPELQNNKEAIRILYKNEAVDLVFKEGENELIDQWCEEFEDEEDEE